MASGQFGVSVALVLAAVTIIAVLQNWNNFLFPLVVALVVQRRVVEGLTLGARPLELREPAGAGVQ